MAPAPVNLEEFGGARLLFSDVRVALMLLQRAHHSAMEKVFGTTREQSALLTFVLAMLVAQAARDSMAQGIQGISSGPSWGDTAIGAAAVKESLHMIAGPSSRDVPLGTMVGVALVARLSVPVIRRSAHGVRSSSRRAHQAFLHRYGHVVHLSRHHYGRLRDAASSGLRSS